MLGARLFLLLLLSSTLVLDAEAAGVVATTGMPKDKLLTTNWKADTVYLWQFPRSEKLPNLSPFCLKVETFLRVKNIPYEICETFTKRSRHGLLPFIELNGRQIADSQLIMHTLQKEFNAEDALSDRDKAIARFIERTVENHTFHVIYRFKLIESPKGFTHDAIAESPAPKFLHGILAPVMERTFKSKAEKRVYIALGDYPITEYQQLLQYDFDALMAVLDDQKYLFGNSITSADCTVFAHLATFYYISGDNYAKTQLALPQNKPLLDFVERVRAAVWPEDFEKPKPEPKSKDDKTKN